MIRRDASCVACRFFQLIQIYAFYFSWVFCRSSSEIFLLAFFVNFVTNFFADSFVSLNKLKFIIGGSFIVSFRFYFSLRAAK